MEVIKGTFKFLGDVVSFVDTELENQGFTPRDSETDISMTYSCRQEGLSVVYEISFGQYVDDLVILINGEELCIDTGFTYKISTPHKTFFGRTPKELSTDFREALEEFV